MRHWGGWLCLSLLGACGGGAPVLGPPPCDLGPGEAGWAALGVAPGEGLGEWLVLENRAGRSVQLNRAVVTVQGRGEPRRWVLEPHELAPGESWRLGEDRLPGLSLADEGGEVVLLCAGEVIHRARWRGSSPGMVWLRDRAAPPRAEDDPDWWCLSEDDAPRLCGLTFCEEAGRVRPVRPVAELSIEEVMADPEGRDMGREWVELQAHTAGDWNGLWVRFRDDGGRERGWRLRASRCLAAQVGVPWVMWLGGEGEGLRAEGPGLPNGGGWLEVGNEWTMDSVELPPAAGGVAWSRDPLGGEWCAGRAGGVAGGAASPGLPNPPCGTVCRDEAGWRAVRPPAPGEVWVSEVAADPSGPDGGREWLELRSSAGAVVDLNGLSLTVISAESGRERHWSPFEEAACVSLAPGGFLVLSGEGASLPGSLESRLVGGFSLYNAPLTVRLEGEEGVVDVAHLPEAVSGRSLGVGAVGDGGSDNDDPAVWCGQRARMADGDYGTPGMANTPCGRWCEADGRWRAWQSPAPGDLAVVALAQGGEGDWLELEGLTVPVDVNGLQVVQENAQGYRRSWVVESPSCLPLEAGSRLRLGAETTPEVDLYLGEGRLWLEFAGERLDEARVRVVRDAVVAVPGLLGVENNDKVSDWCVRGEPDCLP